MRLKTVEQTNKTEFILGTGKVLRWYSKFEEKAQV
jgi:hypothetical protein